LIAQRTRGADPEEVFTAGLLHDIGKVILRIRFDATYDRVTSGGSAAGAASDGTPALVARERDAFGVDHAQAGAWLGEAWSLPVAIVEAAAAHHDELTPETKLSTPVIVNLANRLVHWTDVDQGVLAPEAEAVLSGAAGLSFGACVEIAAQLQGQKDDLRIFYGAD
jgi:putative nucleotidyltransferase with HDIG domain